MIPQVEYALQHNYSVIMMNPNVTKDKLGHQVPDEINGMENHCNYVWRNYIEGND